MILLTIQMPDACRSCPLERKGKCIVKKGRPVPETRPDWCPLREQDDGNEQD